MKNKAWMRKHPHNRVIVKFSKCNQECIGGKLLNFNIRVSGDSTSLDGRILIANGLTTISEVSLNTGWMALINIVKRKGHYVEFFADNGEGRLESQGIFDTIDNSEVCGVDIGEMRAMVYFILRLLGIRFISLS